MATYVIQENRISKYCNNIELGSDIVKVLSVAKGMFGVEVSILQSNPNTHFVKGLFTFKAICSVTSSEGEVIKKFFIND